MATSCWSANNRDAGWVVLQTRHDCEHDSMLISKTAASSDLMQNTLHSINRYEKQLESAGVLSQNDSSCAVAIAILSMFDRKPVAGCHIAFREQCEGGS